MNEHVVNYVKEYIESKTSPQFAIFLKGEWGCGKTYFIKKIINNCTNETELKKKEIMYISLFGVSQMAEIDDLIFCQSHPILSSKPFKFTVNILRALLRYHANFEIEDITENKEKFNINDLKSLKLIIVDDIERTTLSPSQVFGYFSEYLYQTGVKIIFIGNEEHIGSNDKSAKAEYIKIKEKTIGIEFLIQPERENAILDFINELSLKDESFDYIKYNCIEAMEVLKCHNLRTMRQCLYNLKMLFKSLPEDALSKYGKEITKIFINLFIQKNLGFIKEKKDVHYAIVGYEKYSINYSEYSKNREKEEKKPFFDAMNGYIPINNCWAEIIFDGNYSKDLLSKEYKRENTVNSPEQPKNLFVLLSNWQNMCRDEFIDILNKTDKDFKEGMYLHPGEILHYSNVMLIFSLWKLISKKSDDVITLVKSKIKKYKNKIFVVDDWSILNMSYAGWSYDMNTPGLIEIRDLLKTISEENRWNIAKESIENDIKILSANVTAFCLNLTPLNGTNKYYKIPFLYLVDIQNFSSIFLKLDVDDQSCIITALEERYGKKSTNSETIKQENILDKINLIILTDLYDSSLVDFLYDPKEFFKRDISKRLHDLVDFLINNRRSVT